MIIIKRIKTLLAINQSIKKWENIQRNQWVIDKGIQDCKLCKLFYSFRSNCKDCPVCRYTKSGGCKDTPYVEWCEHHKLVHPYKSRNIQCRECAELVNEEIEFLKLIRKLYIGRGVIQ